MVVDELSGQYLDRDIVELFFHGLTGSAIMPLGIVWSRSKTHSVHLLFELEDQEMLRRAGREIEGKTGRILLSLCVRRCGQCSASVSNGPLNA